MLARQRIDGSFNKALVCVWREGSSVDPPWLDHVPSCEDLPQSLVGDGSGG